MYRYSLEQRGHKKSYLVEISRIKFACVTPLQIEIGNYDQMMMSVFGPWKNGKSFLGGAKKLDHIIQILSTYVLHDSVSITVNINILEKER